jgi:hypothetical protein
MLFAECHVFLQDIKAIRHNRDIETHLVLSPFLNEFINEKSQNDYRNGHANASNLAGGGQDVRDAHDSIIISRLLECQKAGGRCSVPTERVRRLMADSRMAEEGIEAEALRRKAEASIIIPRNEFIWPLFESF